MRQERNTKNPDMTREFCDRDENFKIIFSPKDKRWPLSVVIISLR